MEIHFGAESFLEAALELLQVGVGYAADTRPAVGPRRAFRWLPMRH